MPTYTYKSEDGKTWEVTQRITDDPFDYVEIDGVRVPVRRVYSAPGIVLKGKGFYRTGG